MSKSKINNIIDILYSPNNEIDISEVFDIYDSPNFISRDLELEIKQYGDFYNKNEPDKKENKMSEVDLLTKVIIAVTYLYKGDGVAPNVLVSALPNKKIYLSINRYDDKVDRFKKRIIFKSTKNTANETLMDAVKWLVTQKKNVKNPIEELKELINNDNDNGWIDS